MKFDVTNYDDLKYNNAVSYCHKNTVIPTE